MNQNHILLLLLFFFYMPYFNNGIEFNYPAVFNFGDSNSDTGELVAGVGAVLYPPYGQTFFKEPSGRICDGRLIVDFLMDAMDLPFLHAYLEALGVPNFRKGCNFASGGSTVLTTSSPDFPFSFGIQVNQFFRFKSRVLRLQAKSSRFNKYLPSESFFSQGLYMFDIGQNDIAGACYSKTYEQIVAWIPSVLVEFEAGIKKLYNQGARNFWIHNAGPIGCLPKIIAMFGIDPSKLDALGCVSAHNQATSLFNLHLHALVTKLHAQYPNANLTHVDVFTIKYDLIANYSKYGFKQPTMACCGYGGPPLNYNSQVTCGKTKTINGSSITTTVCNDTSEYVNWDGAHYTEAANQHIASQILTGKFSDPSFADKMSFILNYKE